MGREIRFRMSPARPKRLQQSRQSVRNRLLACFHRDHTSFEYLPNRTADIWRCGRYRLYLRYRPHRFPRHFNQPGAIFLEESGRRGNRTRVSEHVRGVAIPLGRLKPSHRMVALPMLRDATGPVHFLPTCRPDCLRREVSIPVPSRQPLIYMAAVYMARANRISGCVSTISARSLHRTPTEGKKKRRPAELIARRAATPYTACRPPVSVRTCR